MLSMMVVMYDDVGYDGDDERDSDGAAGGDDDDGDEWWVIRKHGGYLLLEHFQLPSGILIGLRPPFSLSVSEDDTSGGTGPRLLSQLLLLPNAWSWVGQGDSRCLNGDLILTVETFECNLDGVSGSEA